jgi:hypothetical protein
MTEDISLTTKTQRAQAMKVMPDTERDASILAADNVIDRRAMFGAAQQQRALADAYRGPTGGGTA